MVYRSSIRRSFAKSLTFRMIVVITDIIVIYFLTKKIELSLSIAFFTNIASTLMYYLHERAWNNVDWGKHAK